MAKKKVNRAKMAALATDAPISKQEQQVLTIAEKRCNEALEAFLATKGLPLMALLCRCYIRGVKDTVDSVKLKEEPKEKETR